MIVVFLVGSIFFAFGTVFIFNYYYYRQNGRSLPAKIYGIEKYYSTNSNRSKTLYYSPIVEYLFQGKTYLFKASFGSSNISHKINQKVKVFSLNKGPEYVRLQTKIAWIFPSIFFIVGLILLIWFFSQEHSFEYIALCIFIDLAIPYFIYRKLKEKKLIDQLLDSFMRGKIETEETLKGREIFRSNTELRKELNRYKKTGLIITSVFLSATAYGTYFFHKEMSSSSKNLIQSVLKDLSTWELLKTLPYQSEGEIIGFAFCLFMSLLLIYSLFFQLRIR